MKRRPPFRRVIAPLTLLAGIAATALPPCVHAQTEKTLRFIPERIDFGMVREEGGKVSRTVKAVNISPDSTFIISARTSCGCSAAEYSEAELAPGDTTEVTLTYDPLNRPGKFLKTAKFFTGKERIANSIKMAGNVIPSRRNLDRTYPDVAGPLRLTTAFITAGEMKRSEAKPMFVGLYNDSDRPVALGVDTDAPALEAALMPDTIEAFGVASLSLMLKGRLIPERAEDFMYKAYLINAESGDTIAGLPVGGTVKTN